MSSEYVSTLTGVSCKPRGHQYAGKRFPLEERCPALAKKYPNSVWFTEEGFPDFTPYIVKVNGVEGSVNLDKLRKFSAIDIRNADEIFGIDSLDLGLIWHHVEFSHALILIPRDLHDAVGPHSGGRETNGPITLRARQEIESRMEGKGDEA